MDICTHIFMASLITVFFGNIKLDQTIFRRTSRILTWWSFPQGTQHDILIQEKIKKHSLASWRQDESLILTQIRIIIFVQFWSNISKARVCISLTLTKLPSAQCCLTTQISCLLDMMCSCICVHVCVFWKLHLHHLHFSLALIYILEGQSIWIIAYTKST